MKIFLNLIFFLLIFCSCKNEKVSTLEVEQEYNNYLDQYKAINNPEHFITKLFEKDPQHLREIKILHLFEHAFKKPKVHTSLTSIIDRHSTNDFLRTYEIAFGDSENYSKFQELILSKNDIRIGNLVDNFVFTDIGGNQLKLSDYKNKLIIIDFWATWCKPCLALEDDYKKLVKKYENENSVQFLSLAVRQPKEPWLKHIAQNEIEYPNLIDAYFEDKENFEIPNKYFDLLSIPKFAFIDKNGTTIYANGPQPDSQYFEGLINRYK